MAGKGDASATEWITVRVRLGVPALDAGYTLVPNLLLDHYETLGLTDGAAFFVIRLLRQGAGGGEMLPDSLQTGEHLRVLQDQGLISVRRWPDGVELRLDALFHNLTRLATWLTEGGSPGDFELKVPAEMLVGDQAATDRFDSAEFEAEVADVLAAFAAANRRLASPAEKEQIRNLAVRFDAAARAADEASNGAAWVMAALRSVLERKAQGDVSASDLEQTLEQRMAAAGYSTGTVDHAAKAIRRQAATRIRQMSSQEKAALGRVVEAYKGVTEHPPDDRLVLTLMQLSDKYGPTWVLSAIHEAGTVQTLISPEYVESILVRWQSEGHIAGASEVAESSPVTDPLLVQVMALYKQEIEIEKPLTPTIRDQLLALTEEFRGLDKWKRAFAAAAKSNVRKLSYVEAVLRNKGKKPVPAARRSTTRRRKRGAVREGVWTEEELKAARREALSEPILDPQTFFDEES